MAKISDQIDIIKHSDHVEALLSAYKPMIGDDYEGYRGHIYRVLTYTMHFLGGDPTHRKMIETALVYHDLGLWTDQELAYLEPSIVLAKKDNQNHGWGLDEALLHNLIFWHHKITAYKGPYAELINALRKADWIDASQGRLRKGMPKICIKQTEKAIPNAGFHKTLERLGPELTNNRKLKMLSKFLRVFKI